MSHFRHAAPGREPYLVVRSLALRLPAGHRIERHDHEWGQVLFAPRGANAVRVLEVAPLLRELLLEVVRRGALDDAVDDAVEGDRALAHVLAVQLTEAPDFGMELPLPADPRARRVAGRVLAEPGTDAALDSRARDAGASRRTIERLFVAETGLAFGRWRQQARLQPAVCRLADGGLVTRVALDCGHESASALAVSPRRRMDSPTHAQSFSDRTHVERELGQEG